MKLIGLIIITLLINIGVYAQNQTVTHDSLKIEGKNIT
jgi:hypothetical protein